MRISRDAARRNAIGRKLAFDAYDEQIAFAIHVRRNIEFKG